MKTSLYSHQKKAIEYISNSPIAALFMDPGTGKSLVSLARVEQTRSTRIGIICPNYLKDNWREQIETHFDKPFSVVLWDGFSTKKSLTGFQEAMKQPHPVFFIVNVEAFQSNSIDKYWKQFAADFVICDESVTIKNPQAKRTKSVIDLSKSSKNKLILSGTPSPNSPADLFSQFDFLRSGFWGCSFFQFRHNHLILISQEARGNRFQRPLEKDEFARIKKFISKTYGDELTGEQVYTLSLKYGISERNIIAIHGMTDYSPFKDLARIDKKIDPITFKVKKEDCLDLPDKVFERLTVELTAEQKRVIRELKSQMTSLMGGLELTVSNTVSLVTRLRMITSGLFPCIDFGSIDLSKVEDINDLNAMKTVKRFSPNPKIDVLLSDIETLPDGEPVIIWSNFRESIRYIHEELTKSKHTAAMYYGDVPEKERVEIIEKFKAGVIRFLVMNPMTGGMGLNLQNCSLQYFFDNSYRSDIRVQCEDRSHRIGQKKTVVYKDIVAKNSVDEVILDILKQKQGLLEYFKTNRKNLIDLTVI